jgi:hypothetical protein
MTTLLNAQIWILTASIAIHACGQPVPETDPEAQCDDPMTESCPDEPECDDTDTDPVAAPTPQTTVVASPSATPAPLAANQWLDPINGDLWLIGSVGSWPEAFMTCYSPYRLPSRMELSMASRRGLRTRSLGINSATEGWTDDLASNDIAGIKFWTVSIVDQAQVSVIREDQTPGIFCIHPKTVF